jgi:hypothetical protein
MGAATAIGIGVAVAGITGAVISSNKASKAQGKAANAQLQAAREQMTAQEIARENAVQAAAPSAGELARIDRLIKSNEQGLEMSLSELNRNMEILNTLDPAIKEAGSQALNLLRGQEAKVLGPLREERTRQRRELENQLAARLGGGWRTSSAGIEAMNKFDSATSGTLLTAQQGALTNLGNFMAQQSAARPNTVGQMQDIWRTDQAGQGAAISAMRNIKNAQTAAWTGNAPTAGAALISNAGAPFAGAQAQAQGMQNAFTAMGNLGGQIAGYGLTKPAGTSDYDNSKTMGEMDAFKNKSGFGS